MSAQQVQELIDQVRALPIEEQIELVEQIDQFTWAERWRRICVRIEARLEASGETLTDAEIDEAVKEVRREKSLSERYLTRRS